MDSPTQGAGRRYKDGAQEDQTPAEKQKRFRKSGLGKADTAVLSTQYSANCRHMSEPDQLIPNSNAILNACYFKQLS